MKMAVLDANVLYPAPIRNYLLHLAERNLYAPKWTDKIHDEWIRSLCLHRKDIPIQPDIGEWISIEFDYV
jgi:hypothetical protein